MAPDQSPEGMAEFFNQRASGYDSHMDRTLAESDIYYRKLAHPIVETDRELKILDLGCGTGLEIPGVLTVAPNAHLICIDLSFNMLKMLKTKFPQENVCAVQASYLTFDFGKARFDAALSSMTLHHLLPNEKQHLYHKIADALQPGAVYIEGDYIVSEEKMARLLTEYNTLPQEVKTGTYHIDIPLSLHYKTTLLKKAGFKNIHIVYAKDETVIIAARKPGKGQPHAHLRPTPLH